MIKKVLHLLPVFCFSLTIYGQDSLVAYREISYSSDFERKAFEEFFKKKNQDALPLFLSADALMSREKAARIETQIDGLVESIRKLDLEKKKPDKRIKAVYDKVHDPLLKKYELENRFHEIFNSGNYNCVTATALYALVLGKLEISYEIEEKPTHVYLLAYPNKENILVETTTPLLGYISFNDEFKAQYIANLRKQKIIGSDEAESKTTEELFNSYYFKNEKITLRELIGVHYMNDALFKRDHGKTEEGYYQLEKAYLFYPSQRCKYLLTIFGTEIVTKEKLTPKVKSLFVSKLSRFHAEGITNENIKGEFANLTQDLLFRDNNRALYKECFEIYNSNIYDKDLLNDVNYIFNYENGRAYYNQGNYQKAKPYFEKAFLIQPNNLDLGGIFIGVLAQNFRTMTNEKTLLDSLTKYKSIYPSLTQFNNFNSLLANATAINYGEAFEKGNLELAGKYKDSLDLLVKENPNLNLDYNIIGKAFSSACSYYFKRGQKVKAKAVLTEGLKLSPDNHQLRMRLQMIH